MKKTFTAQTSYIAKKNTILAVYKLSELYCPYNSKSAWIFTGGWQSWNPGFEIERNRKQPSLSSVIKGWDQYLIFPESVNKISKRYVLTQFVSYLRWDNFYLVLTSTGNINNELPPVQFTIDRKKNLIIIEIADKNHPWKKEDLQAEINIFTANSYFEVQSKLKDLFNKDYMKKIENLGQNPCGWESWYNHYTEINQELIYKDLQSLCSNENVISKGDFSSRIFQIDDGWEKGLGNWEWNSTKFSDSPDEIASKIEEKGYIPGLWMAPFIIDSRCPAAKEHPYWLLNDKNGNPVKAGYNPKWGEKGYFYALDLSQDEVLFWIDNNVEKAINRWGFRYLKFDFLYAGMIYGSPKNNDAPFVWYNKAIKMITRRKTNLKGQEVFYLGCGVPFEQSFKYLPLSRIGCDTYEHWENQLLKLINWNGRNSAFLNLKDTLGHALWNKTIFACDPDVIFIREKNCTLTREQKITIATVNTLFGSQFMYSDDPGEQVSETEKELTKEIVEIQKKYKNENFGLTYLGKNNYLLYSESGKYKIKLNLNKGILEK